MHIAFISELKDALVLFAFIGGIYGAYKVLKNPLMSWIKSKLGISDLYEGQAELKTDMKRGLEKLDAVMTQLTINGGSVTVKDDLSIIKKDIKALGSEMRAFTEFSESPIFINNRDGTCTYVNEAICKLFGAKREEMLGFGWVNFLPDDERYVKSENWLRSIQKDSVINDTYHIINGVTGEKIFCEYTATITRDLKGDPITIVGTVRKKDEKKKEV